MIVKNEATLQQAMDLIKIGPVRYQDKYSFAMIDEPRVLETRLRAQLDDDDIAVVVLHGREAFMESYDYEKKLYQRERRIAEQKAARKWVTEHPDQARKYMERYMAREQERVLEANR